MHPAAGLHARFARIAPIIRVELLDQPMSVVQRSVLNGDASFGFGPGRLLEPGIGAETLFTTPVSMLSRPIISWPGGGPYGTR